MALQQVKEYFKTFHIEDRIIELDTSSKTVELAAKALKTNCENHCLSRKRATNLNCYGRRCQNRQ